MFAYTITIANTGAVAAQLVSRHWIITDAEGRVQEVRGPGVVGQQPCWSRVTVRVHERHSLLTTVGEMRGTYQMSPRTVAFNAAIPPFTLSVPRILH